jgi:glycosyltransferase involved in cell wall biosynthesis
MRQILGKTKTSLAAKAGSAPVDLVCFSHLRWNDVFQRPHHLMSRWGRERRVFFIEEYHFNEGPRRLEVRQETPGVHVVVPYLQTWKPEDHPFLIELYADLFKQYEIERYIFWYYSPMFLRFTRSFSPLLTVYDNMDDLASFKGAPQALPALEAEVLEKAALVFTGGYSLYDAKKDRHPSVHPFPSSIDARHFATARQPQPDPEDQAGIQHPRLGYFGVIDERLDLDLLAGLAAARPDWHLVLIGPVVKLKEHELPQAPNIHYLGKKPYKQLPAYLSHWDVALLPFALGPATRFISPTKTPEYLAGGKPVVSAPIRDVVRTYGDAGLVRIAGSQQDFIQAIEATLRESDAEREARLEQVDFLLVENSWDDTWKQMKSMVMAGLNARAGEIKKKRSSAGAARPVEAVPNTIFLGDK